MQSSIPRSTLLVGLVALALGISLVAVLLRPAPTPAPAAAIGDGSLPEPARPGDLNPIAKRVLDAGGPRTPTSSSADGSARAVARFSFAWDGSPASAWSCVEAATQHAASFTAGDPPPCAGVGERKVDGFVVVTRQRSGAAEKSTSSCRALLDVTIDGKRVRVGTEAVPGCGGLLDAAKAEFTPVFAG